MSWNLVSGSDERGRWTRATVVSVVVHGVAFVTVMAAGSSQRFSPLAAHPSNTAIPVTMGVSLAVPQPPDLPDPFTTSPPPQPPAPRALTPHEGGRQAPGLVRHRPAGGRVASRPIPTARVVAPAVLLPEPSRAGEVIAGETAGPPSGRAGSNQPGEAPLSPPAAVAPPREEPDELALALALALGAGDDAAATSGVGMDANDASGGDAPTAPGPDQGNLFAAAPGPAGELGGSRTLQPGLGELLGEGLGTGSGLRRRRSPLELFARVIGGGVPPGAPVAGERPFISLRESTALRTHDFFPRLPAAAWSERRPYVVIIDLCVSEAGQVSDATLLSNRSARFDPLVLDAVRGWRYRARLVEGRPRPFCHQVIIRYDIP